MKFSVLALDYDGTIARDGKTHVTITDAIRDARRQGIILVLVTGRVLSDLRSLLNRQDLFDVIVAENGAVIEYSNSRIRKFGRPPPQEFLDQLAQLKIGFRLGDCVVEADVSAAPEILELIKKLQLPLTLTFNRNRLMVLPQGITKATGLRETLKTLRLSLHNCIGIGDAENDYPLLDACEIGIAVGWASSSLTKIADEVLEGAWPEAIADYIRRVAGQRKLPPKRVDSQHILLGYNEKHEPIETVVHFDIILLDEGQEIGRSDYPLLVTFAPLGLSIHTKEHLFLHGIFESFPDVQCPKGLVCNVIASRWQCNCMANCSHAAIVGMREPRTFANVTTKAIAKITRN